MDKHSTEDDIRFNITTEFASSNKEDMKQIYEILKSAFTVDIPLDKFQERYYSPLYKNTIVCRRLGANEIIGLGSLATHEPLTRQRGVAQIENVAVKSEYRGKGLGEYIVKLLVNLAINYDRDYKIILNCSDSNLSFYERCGFTKVENTMRKDII